MRTNLLKIFAKYKKSLVPTLTLFLILGSPCLVNATLPAQLLYRFILPPTMQHKQVYLDLEKSWGSKVSKDWGLNVGVRWKF